MIKNTRMSWDLPGIDAVLDSRPLHLEMGIRRLDDGRIIVAARNDLLNCKGAMIDWWFKYFSTTEHLKWWYPQDHKHHYGWDDEWIKGENYVGATVHAVEALGDIPPVSAKLRFSKPDAFFSQVKLKAASDSGSVSAAVCACIGFGDDIALDDSGNPLDGRMVHVVRDTSWGCVLRSRFILGESAEPGVSSVSDEVALGLLHHCHCEFSSLSRILPSLYYAENATIVTPPDWW